MIVITYIQKCNRYKGMHILQKKSSVCKYRSLDNVSSDQYFHTLFFSK